MPERESGPIRYELVQPPTTPNLSDDGAYWVEHDPSGVKRYYGRYQGEVAKIRNELGTYAWLLLGEEDRDGNFIQYQYLFGNAPPGTPTQPQNEPVLAGIQWGGNRRAGLSSSYRASIITSEYAGPVDMLHGHVTLSKRVEA